MNLTIIFLTLNLVPKRWAEYQKGVLLEAAQGAPIITISRQPLDWGTNLIQDAEPSVDNIYKQVLRGAQTAQTPYIAIAEDDCLYHQSHFAFRPPLDTFAYDGHRWGILPWRKPHAYYWKDRISNAAMIAPRELVIESLTQRFKKYDGHNLGELGKEKGTQLERYKTVTYWPDVGMIFFSHRLALDHLERTKRKAPGKVQAYDIPYWGRASELVKKFV